MGHRPGVINELRSALIQHRGNLPEGDAQGLVNGAMEVLVFLRKKELTKEWRTELQTWTESLVEVGRSGPSVAVC
jgi:hypothetical protein